MKLRLIAALTVLSVNATAGYAADVALKARPVAPVAYSWSGCYVGAQAGYAFDARSDQSNFFERAPGILVNPQQSETANSWMAGAQGGCNYQFSNRAVIGVETEAWYQDLKATTSPIRLPNSPGEFRNMSFSNHVAVATSIRVGYGADRMLYYAKFGAAFASFKHTGFNSFADFVPLDLYVTGNNFSIGLLAGAGIEYAITNELSIKAEYNYIDFGKVNHPLTVFQSIATPGVEPTLRGNSITTEREQVIKIGLNYRLFAL
jgi:outer membrane immunogenic protein